MLDLCKIGIKSQTFKTWETALEKKVARLQEIDLLLIILIKWLRREDDTKELLVQQFRRKITNCYYSQEKETVEPVNKQLEYAREIVHDHTCVELQTLASNEIAGLFVGLLERDTKGGKENVFDAWKDSMVQEGRG